MSIDNILGKYFLGKQDKSELAQLEQWKTESQDNLKELKAMQSIWTEADNLKGYQEFDTEAALDRITHKLALDNEVKEPINTDSSRPYYVKATLLFLLSIAGLFLFKQFSDNKAVEAFVYEATSSNLSADLPDGTVITLQAGAKVDYSNMIDDRRTVRLDGNAYFDVASDKERPFIVKTVAGDITVVGTEFYVKTIKDKIEIYVEEGHVRYAYDKRTIDLYQGDMARYNDESLVKYTINESNYLSWMVGQLKFVNENMLEVLKDIERHYQADISYKEALIPALLKCEINSTFKDQTIDQVLQELKHIVDLQYTKKNKVIIIDGIKKCKD